MNLKLTLRGCFNNKANCQKLLYDHYYDYAFRIAFRYIYSREQVARLVNSGFVKFFLNIHLIIDKEAPNAEHAVETSLKKTIIDGVVDELLANKQRLETDHVPPPVQSKSLAFNSESAIASERLIAHLRSLPPWPRTMYNMHIVDGFTVEEIANRFAISVSNCKSDISAARMTLQKRIQEDTAYMNRPQTLPVLKRFGALKQSVQGLVKYGLR